MREWLTRIRDWFRRDRLDQELAEELRFHHGLLERDATVAGTDASDAAYAARRKFGNVTRVREESRDRWSLTWLDHAQQDIRYAFRSLRRSPGFTATVMLTLGLGVGANAAMFSVVDRLMFRPFPYLRDPAAVHRVYLQTSQNGIAHTSSQYGYPIYLDLQQATTDFSQDAGISQWQLAVGSGDASRERPVVGVSASFFSFFDARPSLGRFFVAAEDVMPRGASVSVISYGLWKSDFGGADVLGRQLQVGPLVTTIVGVAPKGFVGISEGESPAVFLPITTLAYGVNQGHPETFPTFYGWSWMSVIVRRRPGISVTDASADLTNGYIRSRIAQRLQNPNILPVNIAHPTAVAGALKLAAGPGAGLEAKTLLWVTGVAMVVLLIACANIANLMFARALRRRREIAVRLALGVGRRRLTAQLLTESLILAGLGCGAGIVVAQWTSAFLRQLLIRDGSSGGLATDARTIGVACAFALVAAVVTSVGPAWLAVRGDLVSTLRAGARGGVYQRSRMRSALLILQGALSVVLLVGAGLFVRSLSNVQAMHMGWDPAPVLTVTPNYRGFQMDSVTNDAFRRRLLETAQSIPGVIAATRVNSMPFATNTWSFRVDGIDSVQRVGRFNYQATTPDYFNVMDTRIVRGRGLTAEDRGATTTHVAVVSESMARALWPGKDPLGQCMYFGDAGAPCTSVVGVAEDAVQQSITDTERFLYYLSDEQPPHRPGNRIFLRMSDRSTGNTAAAVERVRSTLQRMMPAQAYVTVAPLEDLVDSQRRSWQLGATMFVGFGVLALVIAAVGLYGVIAYDVAQRKHELGVRVALGAQARDIVRLVVSQGLSFAAAGVTIGVGVTLAAGRWIQPLLFEESARDPIILASVVTAIVLVALAASAVPAVRATRADPNGALRSE